MRVFFPSNFAVGRLFFWKKMFEHTRIDIITGLKTAGDPFGIAVHDTRPTAMENKTKTKQKQKQKQNKTKTKTKQKQKQNKKQNKNKNKNKNITKQKQKHNKNNKQQTKQQNNKNHNPPPPPSPPTHTSRRQLHISSWVPGICNPTMLGSPPVAVTATYTPVEARLLHQPLHFHYQRWVSQTPPPGPIFKVRYLSRLE